MIRKYLLVLMIQLNCSVVAESFASEIDSSLPEGSELISINGHMLHIRKSGLQDPSKPYIVLLSGPTDNWHSDSGWWALGQNYLAEKYQTVAIDRAGHAWSEPTDTPSYQQFAGDLADYVVQQNRPVLLVAFASSNLSVHILMQNTQAASLVKGAVLIDPDVLTKHSITHYTSETEGYRKGWSQIEQFINEGQYDDVMERTIEEERKHVSSIISGEHEKYMDWHFYSAIETIRNSRRYQLEKFRETTHYRDDLMQAKSNPLPTSLPIVIIDSDFETGYLAKIEDKAVRDSIIQWRDEGKDWFLYLAKKSQCGGYWPTDSQEHLVMMEQPELLTRAVKKILSCEQHN